MTSTVAFFALNALVWWVVVLAHELGHAAVGLTRTEGLVIVRVGRHSPIWRRRFGRLKLELSPVPMFFRSAGEAVVHARLGRTTRVMFALAGPVAGCIAAALLVQLGSHLQFRPLQVIGVVAMVFDLANLIPFRFRGFRSDGVLLVEAIHGRAPGVGEDDRLEPIASRWFVLATDVGGAFADRDRDIRAHLSSKMCSARANDNSEAMAVHQLTFAGWCWRQAEEGDTTPLRVSVLDARHRATGKGLSRANIIAAAAGELVRERTDLAAGSPAPDSLEQGFRLAHANGRYGELSESRARVAFCFGVALHDVAAIAG